MEFVFYKMKSYGNKHGTDTVLSNIMNNNTELYNYRVMTVKLVFMHATNQNWGEMACENTPKTPDRVLTGTEGCVKQRR